MIPAHKGLAGAGAGGDQSGHAADAPPASSGPEPLSIIHPAPGLLSIVHPAPGLESKPGLGQRGRRGALAAPATEEARAEVLWNPRRF